MTLKGDTLMPTGPKHIYTWEMMENGKTVYLERVCRCTFGADHDFSDDMGYSWDEAGNMMEDGEYM